MMESQTRIEKKLEGVETAFMEHATDLASTFTQQCEITVAQSRAQVANALAQAAVSQVFKGVAVSRSNSMPSEEAVSAGVPGVTQLDVDVSEQMVNDMSDEELFKKGRGNKLQQARINGAMVRNIYEEYMGLGGFKDLPVPGGYERLEKTFGNKWRKGVFDKKDDLVLSRVKKMVEYVGLERLKGRELDAIIMELQAIKESERCNNSVANLIQIMREDGMLSFQTRKRKTTTDEAV